MKKIELSHDIIAEKIWERIPENDKRLQEIKRQLGQRIKNYCKLPQKKDSSKMKKIIKLNYHEEEQIYGKSNHQDSQGV